MWNSGRVVRYYFFPGKDFEAPLLPHAITLRSARDALQTALDVANGKRSKIKSIREIDFGPHMHLYEECYHHVSGEFKYTLCPFKDVRQDHVSLGKFANWTNGGIGAADDECEEGGYADMLYADGQVLQRVNRSTRVSLVCGTKNCRRHRGLCANITSS